MASEKRQQRVAEQIRKDLSMILLREHGELAARVSFSEVRLSPDLSHATIFVSILADGLDREELYAQLRHSNKALRKSLAATLRIRAVPLLKFVPDESVERAAQVGRLLDQIEGERADAAPEDED